MKAGKVISLIVPFVVAAAVTALSFTALFQSAEGSIYDALLHVRPAVSEHPDLLIINIDDTAIAQIGMYPLSRDIMADGMILMREMGASYAVLDIEFVDRSPPGINTNLLEEDIPAEFNDTFAEMQADMSGLIEAVAAGQIPLDQATAFLDDLGELTNERRDELLNDVYAVARDNDEYFGSAVGFFGTAVATVNMLDNYDETVDPDLRAWVQENIPLRNVTLEEGSLPSADDIRPTIRPILSRALAAGYPRVYVDPDGVRRRTDLMYRFNGRVYPHLGFAGLLEWLGSPSVEVNANRVLLRGANHPERGETDIAIPRATDGRMLINWPKGGYLETFEHLSWSKLFEHDRLMADLEHNMGIMETEGFTSFHDVALRPSDRFDEINRVLDAALANPEPRTIERFGVLRESLLQELDRFLTGDAEALIRGEYERLIAEENLDEQTLATVQELIAFTEDVFAATRRVLSSLRDVRSELRSTLEDRFTVVGYSGTSTTDIGVNPFEPQYMNVGLYPSVINTIISGSFLDDAPWWMGAAAALVLSLGVTLIVSRLQPVGATVVGTFFVLLVIAGVSSVFVFFDTYVSVLVPTLAVFLTFLLEVSRKFIATSQEKGAIRDAFGQYLSGDVIEEILADPSKLELGGTEEDLTAIFTDIAGFSGIAEALSPTKLVKLLNEYLTELTDRVLEEGGTIDKFEGDAIIAFFGAPKRFDDHAKRAARAAIGMKKIEKELNQRFLDSGATPKPLLTRVGINTGEMVVGNMGTSRKMDYTIMGNAVNLSARLESVNKQYGTWIMISEYTKNQLDSSFFTRSLDKVQVVGISRPVRLYELLDLRSDAPGKLIDGVSAFEEGLELYENRQFKRAAVRFADSYKLLDKDQPSKMFFERCKLYLRNPAEFREVLPLTSK